MRVYGVLVLVGLLIATAFVTTGNVKGMSQPVPTTGMQVTWDEYSWGGLTGQVTMDGINVAGVYDGASTTPLTEGWNNYFLVSSEVFSDAIEFTCNITPTLFSATEAMIGIGIRAPSAMDESYRDSIVWCMYYYSSSGMNTIGWLHTYMGGVIERTTFDERDIVQGVTVEYKMMVSDGQIGYYLNGQLITSGNNPLNQFNLLLTTGIKYEGSVISADFEDVSVLPVTSPVFRFHGPISISSNADFTAANGVTHGSGTPWDPYVIEGWDIVGAYIAIKISNTDAWFVIRDVYLHQGTGGVYFYTVENAMIENARMEGFAHAGIAVWSSKNVFITQSSSSNNGHEGIILRDSLSLNITENRVTGNLWQGIMLERCTRSWVFGNVIEGNVLEKDTAGYPYQAGIVLFSCSGVGTYRNTVVQAAEASAYDNALGSNVWDSGYPMGGNFWSAYPGTDVLCGPLQNVFGSDQLGDAPYDIAGGAKDNYPIMLMQIENTEPAAPFSTYMVATDGEVKLGVDASFCRDNQDPPDALLVRWDWQDDGIWDTEFSSTKIAFYHYPASGTYTIRLQVLDRAGLTNESIRTQYVDVDHPIANAGPDQIVIAGDTIALDASGSYDGSGIRSYEWTFFDGAACVLEGVSPTYIFDTAGVYLVNMVVTDMFGNAASDSMIVTVWGQTITLVKNTGPARSSSVQWYLEPSDYGLWSLRIENFNLRSVTIDVYDATSGFQESVYHAKIRFSSHDAVPYGIVTTDPVVLGKGHVYLIVVTPLGPTGSYVLMNEQFTNQA